MNDYRSMLLVKGTERLTGTQKATFKLIPISNDCPFIEAIFDSTNLALGIVGKYKKNNYEMVPTLNKDGDLIKKKRTVKEGEFPFQQEKRLIESWNEYEIVTKDEIVGFIEMFAVNSQEFDYKSYLDAALEKHKLNKEANLTATVTEKVEA